MTHFLHITIQGRTGDIEAAFDAPPRTGDQILITDPLIGTSEFRTVEACWHSPGAQGQFEYWVRLGAVVAPQ